MNEVMQNLAGRSVSTADGKNYTLWKLAGYGAQGVVYEDITGSRMIKLYYPTGSKLADEDILERLRFIHNVSLPANFVGIEGIISSPCIGYVMEKVTDHRPLNNYLIPDRGMPFSEWYNQGRGLHERIFIGYIIAKAFGALERSNLSYCDISGNNILVRTGKTASIKMIDVDNIYVAGRGMASILGTPRYIAPEIISRHRNPDVLSDNYSLAVILFELLRAGHPYISDDIMDGTPEDEEAALSGKSDYVTDDNSTNMLPADIVFTDKLKKLFRRCFVDGKKNRMARPSAREFEAALLEASNKVIKCPSCGAWHYPRKKGRIYEGCPWCDAPSRPKARLNFYNVLTYGGDYRTGKTADGSRQGELVNTYILREGKNQIQSLYVLRYDDPGRDESGGSENYMTIVKDNDDYWAYNAFDKDTIAVRKYRSGQYSVKSADGIVYGTCGAGEYIRLESRQAIKLENGDFIYFEPGAVTEAGRKEYSLIRMARLLEEDQ